MTSKTPSDSKAQAFQNALDLHQAGNHKEAEAAYRLVLRLDPDNIAALNNLGNVLLSLGRPEEAEPYYRHALHFAPETAVIQHHLGKALAALGRNDEAERHLRKACELGPGLSEPSADFAFFLHGARRFKEAEQAFSQAIALKPGDAALHNGLGVVRALLGRKETAVQCFQRAIELKPGLAEAHANLGKAFLDLQKTDEAESSLHRALELDHNFAVAHYNLATVMFSSGRLEEAEAGFRRTLELDPANTDAIRMLPYMLNYVPGKTPAEIYSAHLAFAKTLARPLADVRHDNKRDPRRRLRVGYVSGDFLNHSVAIFIEPVLASHDRGQFEIFCYFNHSESDAVTVRLRSCTDNWRDINSLDDEQFASLIRADSIDILVDLSGHTARNRLSTFALKPAPVQATWLGYQNSTGLEAMDYRITDAQASPPGLTDAFHTEKLMYLPKCACCYRPPAGSPDVAPTPCIASGTVTFGSFTNLSKITVQMIELWARLLARVPKSRLLVVSAILDAVPGGSRDYFARHGIPPERLELLGRSSMMEYLDRHRLVDIILDAFPTNGYTTTCHAMWMGVPVVTLAGDTVSSRDGASFLHAVGLQELVAYNTDEYLEHASGLAGDPTRLAAMRAGMRNRMTASPLMDEAGFTRDLETAYRAMWHAWCAKGSASSH